MGFELFEAIDLGELGKTIQSAENTVLRLLDERDRVEERLDEVRAYELVADRLEQEAQLWDETQMFMARCKAMVETIGNAKKRVEEASVKIEKAVMVEVERFEDGKTVSSDHAFAIRKKPAIVVVDDLVEVPRKYRLEPKPIPPWEQWPVDKNMVKQAITKEKVGKIKGLHIDESGKRIEIKSR